MTVHHASLSKPNAVSYSCFGSGHCLANRTLQPAAISAVLSRRKMACQVALDNSTRVIPQARVSGRAAHSAPRCLAAAQTGSIRSPSCAKPLFRQERISAVSRYTQSPVSTFPQLFGRLRQASCAGLQQLSGCSQSAALDVVQLLPAARFAAGPFPAQL